MTPGAFWVWLSAALLIDVVWHHRRSLLMAWEMACWEWRHRTGRPVEMMQAEYPRPTLRLVDDPYDWSKDGAS